jgi:hypothetical protein
MSDSVGSNCCPRPICAPKRGDNVRLSHADISEAINIKVFDYLGEKL